MKTTSQYKQNGLKSNANEGIEKSLYLVRHAAMLKTCRTQINSDRPCKVKYVLDPDTLQNGFS